jgi:hypothetical protein
MKLGEIAHISRGIVTGDRKVFVMTRDEAATRGIEAFVYPIIDGAREIPDAEQPSLSDNPSRLVVLLATRTDVEATPALKAYLDEKRPKVASFKPSPIVVTYVGTPRFAGNLENLVVLNSLYCVRPKKQLTAKQIMELVRNLNAVCARLTVSRFAQRRSPSDFNALEI